MAHISGTRSYEGVKKLAQAFTIGDCTLLVASLADIIRSKRAAGRPKDRAVLAILEMTHEEEVQAQSGGRARKRK